MTVSGRVTVRTGIYFSQRFLNQANFSIACEAKPQIPVFAGAQVDIERGFAKILPSDKDAGCHYKVIPEQFRQAIAVSFGKITEQWRLFSVRCNIIGLATT